MPAEACRKWLVLTHTKPPPQLPICSQRAECPLSLYSSPFKPQTTDSTCLILSRKRTLMNQASILDTIFQQHGLDCQHNPYA